MDQKVRYYPIYGIGKDGRRATDIGRIYERDIHKPEYRDKRIIVLKTGKLLEKKKYALVLSGLANKAFFRIPLKWKRNLASVLDTVEMETQQVFDSLDLSSV